MAEITTNVKASNLLVSNVFVQKPPLTLSNVVTLSGGFINSNVVLNIQDHADRLLLIPDRTSNGQAIVLPNPVKGGETFKFLYADSSRCQSDVAIRLRPNSSVRFEGAVTVLSNIVVGSTFGPDTSNGVVFANTGSTTGSNSNLYIKKLNSLDLTFTAANTSAYIVNGVHSSGFGNASRAVTFNNQDSTTDFV